jgi:hypothetical protein
MHEVDAFKATRIGDDRMAAVQDADFHHLEGMNSIGEGDANLLQRRAASGKIILQHPLPERLAGHRNRIVPQTELRRHLPFPRPGGGRDPVNHAVRKGDMGLDPIGQIGVRQARRANHGRLRHMAIARQIVAAHHRERDDPGRAAGFQGRDDGTKGCGRFRRIGAVLGDIR